MSVSSVSQIAFEATPLLGPKTGVAEFCYGAISGLNDLGRFKVDPFVVSWRNRGKLRDALPNVDLQEHLPMPARPLHAMWSKINFPPLEMFIRNADVVHGSNFVVPPTWRAKRVVTVHDLTPLLYQSAADPATLIFPRLIQQAIDSGAFVHTPSHFVRSQLLEYFDVDPSRVFAVHHGIPTQASLSLSDAGVIAKELLETNGLVPKHFILGLGTVEPRKDFVSLVKGFVEIASDYPDLMLVIAGQPGWGSVELDAEIKGCGLVGRIARLGYVNALVRRWLLENALSFVYSSIYEGFGFPPLEAMSLGTPVISTTTGSLPEVLGDAAIWVKARDANAIAGAIDGLILNDASQKLYASLGLRRVKDFSWQKCALGLSSIYDEAIKG